MIAVEANQKKRSTKEMPEDSKESAPQSSWDADAFAKQVDDADDSWKERETAKGPTRVQDISVGITSQHREPVKKQDETWPYESSPCRIHGGKNTKKGCEDMNKELFDPDFADNQSDNVSFSDVDSFCGEEDTNDDDVDEAANDDDEEEHLQDEGEKRGGASHTQMLAWNRQKQDSDYSLDDGEDDELDTDHEEKSQGSGMSRSRKSKNNRRSSLSKSGSQRGLGLIKSSSQRALGMIKSNSQRALGLIKSKSQRALKTVTSKSPGHRSNSKSPGDRLGRGKKSSSEKKNKDEDELAASSLHSSRSSRRKSKRNTDNDLSAATMHGTGDGGRGNSRRSTRAPARVKSSDNMEVRGSSRSSRDDLGAATLHGRSSISRIRKDQASQKPSRRGKPDRRSMMNRAMSTTNVKRPEEYHGGGRGAVGGLGTISDDIHSPGRNQSRHQKRPTEPRRDIMELLKGQKEVTEKDLADSENRKILSYLMLEHKLGINLGELARTVRKETKDGVVPSPPKPELYVEAA